MFIMEETNEAILMIEQIIAEDPRLRELERECEEKGIPVDMYLNYVKKNYGTVDKYKSHIRNLEIDCDDCYHD